MAVVTTLDKNHSNGKVISKKKAGDKFLEELEEEAAAPPVEEQHKAENKKPVPTYFRPALLKEINQAALEDDVSRNTWITNACKFYLEYEKSKRGIDSSSFDR